MREPDVEPSSNASPRTDAVGRYAASVVLDTVWYRRGSFDDTTLWTPARLAAKGTMLLVPDFDRGGYHLIDGRDGRLLAFHGRRGRGPGEFLRMTPVALHGSPDSAAFAILDESNQRMTRIGADGRPSGAQRVDVNRILLGACSLGDTLYASTSVRAHSALVRFIAGGDSVEIVRSAWRDHLDTMDLLLGQFRLREVAPGVCTFLPSIGPLNATLFTSDGERLAAIPPREPVAWPSVGSRPEGAGERRSLAANVEYSWISAARVGDLLVAAFDGSSEQASRWLDLFEWGSFAYRGSIVLPWKIDALAGSADALFVLGKGDDGYFRLGAFRLRASRP